MAGRPVNELADTGGHTRHRVSRARVLDLTLIPAPDARSDRHDQRQRNEKQKKPHVKDQGDSEQSRGSVIADVAKIETRRGWRALLPQPSPQSHTQEDREAQTHQRSDQAAGDKQPFEPKRITERAPSILTTVDSSEQEAAGPVS
jgi:hypothetical protein